MTKATTLKAISLTTIIAVATAFSPSAFASDQEATENTAKTSISKSHAKNLVKALLKRDYKGQGLKAYPTTKVDGKWQVAIKYNVNKVGTAFVDAKTGRISSKK